MTVAYGTVRVRRTTRVDVNMRCDVDVDAMRCGADDGQTQLQSAKIGQGGQTRAASMATKHCAVHMHLLCLHIPNNYKNR